MKTYTVSNTILDLDLTEVRKPDHKPLLLQARDKIRSVPCWQQCALYDRYTHRCPGYCYRWKNFMSIVFKLVEEPQGDYTVVETEYARQCRLEEEERLASQNNDRNTTAQVAAAVQAEQAKWLEEQKQQQQ